MSRTLLTQQAKIFFASYLTGTVWAAGTLLAIINGKGFTKRAAAVMLLCLVVLLCVSIPTPQESLVANSMQRNAATMSFGVFALSCAIAVCERPAAATT